MYKNLALINGVILAIMVFLNGMLGSKTGPYLSTLIYHLLGLLLIIALSIFKGNKLSNFKTLSPIFFIPGLLSVLTILFNNIAIPKIGLSLCIGIGLFGQLVMSCIVEHFGLFGMPLNKFKNKKLLGFSIISLGIVIMMIM
jgi:transporter family-2 protein